MCVQERHTHISIFLFLASFDFFPPSVDASMQNKNDHKEGDTRHTFPENRKEKGLEKVVTFHISDKSTRLPYGESC